MLQRAAIPPKDGRTDREICHLGNLSALEYFENVNAYFQEIADDECNPSPGEATHVRAKIQQTRITFHKIFQMEKDVVNRRRIPIVDSCHFCPSCRLQCCLPRILRKNCILLFGATVTRGSRGVGTGTLAADIVGEVNDFCELFVVQTRAQTFDSVQ